MVAQAEQDGAISALSQAILLHADKRGGPPVVKGKLQDLAGAANLPLLDAYHALHELIDRGCLRLVDDPLTVLDRDQLESVAAS